MPVLRGERDAALVPGRRRSGGGDDGGDAGQGVVADDDQEGEDGQGRAEDLEPGRADEQAHEGGQAGTTGGGRTDLPGDGVLGPAAADAGRGQADQGRKHAGQGRAQQHETGQGHRAVRSPPDRGRTHHGQGAPPADHADQRQLAGQQGQQDTDAGQGGPVAEGGQAGRGGGQAEG